MTTTNPQFPSHQFAQADHTSAQMRRVVWRGLMMLTLMVCSLVIARVEAQTLIPQVITFGPNPGPVTYRVGVLFVSATGGASGNPVVLTTLTPGVCDATMVVPPSGTITMRTAGTCIVAANQMANATYAAAAQATQTIVINPISQTITFEPHLTEYSPHRCCAAPDFFYVSATGGTSGNPVIFTSLTPDVCMASATQSPGVGANIFVGPPGTCIIAADQTGNATYAPAQRVTRSVTVLKRNQTIVFGTNPGPMNFAPSGTFAVSAKATPAGLDFWDTGNPVIFSSLTTSICTVTGNTVTMLAPGTCTIAGNQPGNALDNPAPQATQSIVINPIPQTITFGVNPGPLSYNNFLSFTVNATGGASGNPITFSSLTPAICNPDVSIGNKFFSSHAGTCIVAANQAGSASYAAAVQTTQSIVISQGVQVLTFPAPNPGPVSLVVGGTFLLRVSGGTPLFNSGLPITFSTLTPGVCTPGAVTGRGGDIVSAQVNMLAAGTCTIAANEAGNSDWLPAAQVTQSITIAPPTLIPQSITFGPNPGPVEFVRGTTSFGVSVSGGINDPARVNPTSPITFSSLTPSVCEVGGVSPFSGAQRGSSATIRINFAGTCRIAANSAADANFLAAPQVTQDIIIKFGQNIGFRTNATPVTFIPRGTFTIVASANASASLIGPTQNLVSFTSLTLNVCTVGAGTVLGGLGGTEATVTMVRAGACTIAANQAGDALYNPAPQETQTIVINKAAQTITVDPIPDTAYSGGGGITVRATSPTFSPVEARFIPVSLTPSVCRPAAGSVTLSISGITSSVVSILSAGVCTVRFSDPGNANYLPAPDVDVSFTIARGAQRINFNVGATSTILGNAPVYFDAFAVGSGAFFGSNGNVVTVASDTPQICTVSRGVAFTICFPATSNAPELCALFSDVITFTGTGTCSVTATQPGNANYLPATPVTRTIQVEARAAVQSSAVVARFGDMQTLTANIAGTNPTGTVRFSLNTGEVIPGCNAVPVVNARASCFIPPRYQSRDPLIFSVDYSGDGRNPAATSYYEQAIFYNVAALSTSVEPANPVPAGGRATVTALVRMRNPVGTVSFFTEELAPGTSAIVRTALAGCDARPLTMLPNATDSALATCTLTAPVSGTAKVVARYSYPSGHVSNRVSEEESQTISVIANAPTNYTDMWWGGARENGWGVSITQHGGTQFNVIFAYDNAGKPTWYVMPGCTWSAANTVCTGSLYQPTGAPFSAYDVTRFAANAAVGTATFTYKSANTATLSYNILGVAGSKDIERQAFGSATTQPNLGVNDLWWNGPAENGWGINIAQQGRQLFPVWYTYGTDGKPTFFTVPGGTWNGLVFTGDIYTTTSSPWLGVPYDASRFAATKVGTMIIDYRDANAAAITYTIGSVTQTKVITRQGF